jgi:glycine cleavage system H protein
MSIHKFASSHEWIKVDAAGIGTVGISDYAQDALGDIVFVDLPAVGSSVVAGKETAVVESVKSVSDIYSPVSGEVVAVNDALTDAPETINAAAESDGWLFKVKLSNTAELDNLLEPADYAKNH